MYEALCKINPTFFTSKGDLLIPFQKEERFMVYTGRQKSTSSTKQCTLNTGSGLENSRSVVLVHGRAFLVQGCCDISHTYIYICIHILDKCKHEKKQWSR